MAEKEKKHGGRNKGEEDRYNPADPKNAKRLKIRTPKNLMVLEDGTLVRMS